MTPRAKLQAAYELAFFPPASHRLWSSIRDERPIDPAASLELVNMALSLHLALPEEGYASVRALKRVALYQARSRPFGLVTFLRNIRTALGATEPFDLREVPGYMIRDIGLPPFSHHATPRADSKKT